MNTNWPRWIHASLDKFIKATVTELPVFADHDDKPPEQSNRLEFNWIGPSIFQPTKTSFVLTLNLVVLVTTIPDDVRAFKDRENQGIGLKAVPACIPVYKYGNLAGDDNTQLGILVRQDPVNEYMVGHQERTNRIRQAGITAAYRMDL